MKTRVSPQWPRELPADPPVRVHVRREPLRVQYFPPVTAQYAHEEPDEPPQFDNEPPEHWSEEDIARHNRYMGRLSHVAGAAVTARRWAGRGLAAVAVGALIAATYAAWRWWQQQRQQPAKALGVHTKKENST